MFWVVPTSEAAFYMSLGDPSPHSTVRGHSAQRGAVAAVDVDGPLVRYSQQARAARDQDLGVSPGRRAKSEAAEEARARCKDLLATRDGAPGGVELFTSSPQGDPAVDSLPGGVDP